MKALLYENNEFKETTIPDGDYPSYTDNMDDPCTCPNCGKTYKFGDMYTSRKWYRPGGVFSFYVCEDCYEEEWK